jgi:16S rRNA G1207 methylase RsmC
MTAGPLFQTPFGDFRLRRHPARRDEPLLAWCAADLLLLEEACQLGIPTDLTLVVNDEHGALCVPLRPRALWTDSALAALALRRNLQDNAGRDVPVVWSTAEPAAGCELIVMRIPKQLAYLEYQLEILSRIAAPAATVLAAGMDKHLSPQVAHLLERYIGPTQRHRGQRKARLFSARRDGRVSAPPTPLSSYYCEAAAGELQALPNVFSRDRVDGGSRLLLAQLPRLAAALTVHDLACGNGVIGLAAFRLGLASELVFADESAMAIASARMNAHRLFPADSHAFAFHHGDGLSGCDTPPAGLILCNPPFHLTHAVDDYAGRRLLAQCAHHLQRGGRLCLVANRHLDYLPTLKRYFQPVEQLARDRRFVVWLAQRR